MKTPLLLLHGALGSKKQFEGLCKILSEERKVLVMNFEGHGDFKSESNFSISLFRDNVISFLNKNNITSVDIFGYSMGGYVALDLAYHHPQLVSKIITLGTKFQWNPDFASREIKMLNPDKIEEKVPNFAKNLHHLHGTENWRNVVLKTASFMKNLGNNPSLEKSELSEISNEILIGLGELDKMVTVEESKEVAEWLPNGKFKLIADFKHPIESVPTSELAEIINTFLDK